MPRQQERHGQVEERLGRHRRQPVRLGHDLGPGAGAPAGADRQEVVDQGLKLLRALSFHGLSQVEFKRDPRDGAYKLMEVNPRLFQWHGLAAACGVDLPLIAYRDLTGEAVEPDSANGRRRRWAITLQAGESPALQRPPYVDAVFARDDLKPAVVQVARLLRR